MVRSTAYRDLNLKFIGIGNRTNELIAMRTDGIYEKVMVDRFVEDAQKSEVFFDIGEILEITVLFGKRLRAEYVIVGSQK